MTSYPFRSLILLILLVVWPLCRTAAQSQVPLVLDSGISVNLKLNKGFTLNAGLGYRDLLVSDIGDSPLAPDSRHLQLATNLNYQLGFYDRLGGGFMYRFNSVGKDGVSNELRLSQEYIHVRKFTVMRLAHRLKLDQRIFKSLSTEYRFRYRISIDLPLNGVKLDPGEFYALASTETLLNLGQAFTPDWDQRFNLGIGNQVNKAIKGQFDLQYRADSFSKGTLSRVFLVAAVIVGL